MLEGRTEWMKLNEIRKEVRSDVHVKIFLIWTVCVVWLTLRGLEEEEKESEIVSRKYKNETHPRDQMDFAFHPYWEKVIFRGDLEKATKKRWPLLQNRRKLMTEVYKNPESWMMVKKIGERNDWRKTLQCWRRQAIKKRKWWRVCAWVTEGRRRGCRVAWDYFYTNESLWLQNPKTTNFLVSSWWENAFRMMRVEINGSLSTCTTPFLPSVNFTQGSYWLNERRRMRKRPFKIKKDNELMKILSFLG